MFVLPPPPQLPRLHPRRPHHGGRRERQLLRLPVPEGRRRHRKVLCRWRRRRMPGIIGHDQQVNKYSGLRLNYYILGSRR